MVKTSTNVKPKKDRKRMFIVLLVIALLAIIFYVSYRGTYLKTLEIGEQYLSVLEKNIRFEYGTMLANFIVLFISIFITTKLIHKGLKKFFEEEKKNFPKLPSKSISFILAAVIAIFTTNILVEKVMLGLNSAWFGISDPIFNTDIGFYIFQKPAIELIIAYFIAIIVGLALYTAIYYIITFNVYFDGIDGKSLKKSLFIKQITTYLMLIVLLFATLIIVKMQGVVRDSLLTLQDEDSSKIFGAGLTDITIKLWGYRILSVVMIISVWLAIKNFKKGIAKKVIQSLLIVPAYMVVMFVSMIGFQALYVNSNELDKQKEYIQYNIDYTKSAYNIEIEEYTLTDYSAITIKQAEENNDVITNIPITTKDITLTTLNETQTSTGYYYYNNTALAEYNNSLIYLSPREISNINRTYNNKTYELTHGYGAVITSATTSDDTGNIKYIQKDFNDNNFIEITNPRIYYGIQTTDTVISNENEFDYPINSNQNTITTYNGNGGITLSIIDRIILGIHEKDLKIAFSDVDNNKILINRNILKRAKSIMPYLIYDDEPYLVVRENGDLVWVIDAYTVSNQYPYSQSSIIENDSEKQEINYIRNSVKVIVDAYNGTTDFYITDKTDPIVMAYKNIYTNLFKEVEDIPNDIVEHFKYSEFLYNIQAEILKNYHNVTPDVLYRGDDMWDIAAYSTSNTATKGSQMKPFETMVKTVDAEYNKLGLVLPYTPIDKQNIISYLVGTTSGTSNILKLYRFSSDSNILGPNQLEKQIQEDKTISAEIQAVNVTGTKLIKNMIIVPIDSTLLYVEPIYQVTLNEKQSIPVLKKIVVASGNKVAIGDDLSLALKKLLSEYAVKVEVEDTETIEGLIDAIIKANNNLDESNSTKNWEQMGRDITKLQELIKQMETLQNQKEQNENIKNDSIEDIGNEVEQNLINSID